MLRSQIEDEISKAFNLEKTLSHRVVDLLISSMSKAISENDRVEIRGFGSFYPKKYKSYKGRNPKTGESIQVPEKILPLYRPSRDLLDKLNDK
jgi:integration host factor subunit beta|tara:strand:- start:899 stop:1177 length:279 start_codon:yes stop_codon:yes gene_type:complete